MLYEKYKIENSQIHKYKRQRPRNPLYRRVSCGCCWIVVRKAGYQLIDEEDDLFGFFLKNSHFSQVFSSCFHYCHYQSWQILQIPQESVQLYSTLETLLPKSWLQLTGEQNIPTFSKLVLFPRSARVSDFKFILILTNVIVCCRSCFNGINGAVWQEGRTTCTPQTKQPKKQWQWEKSTKKRDLIISGAKNMLVLFE